MHSLHESNSVYPQPYSVAPSISHALHQRVSSCPNLPILGLESLPYSPSQEYIPKFAFGTTMNSPQNYRLSPSSSTSTNANVSANMHNDTDTTAKSNRLKSIREHMMRQEHKYSRSYDKQEPLLPPPPLHGDDDTSRTNDAETSTSESNPYMRQPQDTLRSLLYSSAASRAEPYARLSPRTPPTDGNDHSNPRPGLRMPQNLPPTPRTPGRRHAALAADAGWNRSPPRLFPRTLLPLEEASQEVTKKIRTESGPIAVLSTSLESSSSSGVRMRPQFQSGHVLQTLARALSVPFPTDPASTSTANEVQPPGPPPLHIAQTSLPAANTGRDHRPSPPKKATSDITDFPSIDFASLGIPSTPESKLTGSSGPPRIVRSDSEQRRPRRRMSAPSA